jgi:DNA-directed RNA polymerase subunit RPC12/RpoP
MLESDHDFGEDPEFMGGSWYCAHCGCEFSPDGDPHPPETPCPGCGRILLRSGGSRDPS